MTTLHQAAFGYLELGMHVKANAEIENLPPDEKVRVAALELRLEIYRQARPWALMEVVARELLRRMPENPMTWVDVAIAVRRTDSVQAARELLEQAKAMFPENATIHFNLVCYACLLGDIEEAKRRVEKATSLDRKFQMLGLDDPDLEPIWGGSRVASGNRPPSKYSTESCSMLGEGVYAFPLPTPSHLRRQMPCATSYLPDACNNGICQ